MGDCFMGYPKITIFDKCLIERTIQNLDNYKGDYEFTHLINSLLTLIVLPHEYYEREYYNLDTTFLDEKISDINEIKAFFIGAENLNDENNNNYSQKRLILKSCTFREKSNDDLSLKELLRRLRHGIAHHNIKPTRDDNKSNSEKDDWKGVIIRCYPTEKGSENKNALEWNDKFTLEVYFSYEDLKTFSKYVANKYIENIIINKDHEDKCGN